MKNNPIKVSLIVNIYNEEKSLPKCLNRIINQWFENIEIICVNDGATDSSKKILKNYKQLDERIKIIESNQHLGKSASRNFGIDVALGEYIIFVNPKDLISEYMVEKLYNQAQKADSDVVVCDYINKWGKNNKTLYSIFFSEAQTPFSKTIVKVPVGNNISDEIRRKSLLVSPCYTENKIYKTSFIRENNIRFSNIQGFEDVLFSLKSHIFANGISYINEKLYTYSIEENIQNTAKALIEITDEVYRFLHSYGLMAELRKNFDYFIVTSVINNRKILNEEDIKKIGAYLSDKEIYYSLLERLKVQLSGELSL